jgi:hypothetical protein
MNSSPSRRRPHARSLCDSERERDADGVRETVNNESAAVWSSRGSPRAVDAVLGDFNGQRPASGAVIIGLVAGVIAIVEGPAWAVGGIAGIAVALLIPPIGRPIPAMSPTRLAVLLATLIVVAGVAISLVVDHYGGSNLRSAWRTLNNPEGCVGGTGSPAPPLPRSCRWGACRVPVLHA